MNRLVGSGYHFIQLPPDSAGKSITITLKATENDAFTSIAEIEITDSVDAYTYFAEKNITAIFVSMFLFTLGIVLSVTSIFALCYNKAYVRLVYIGLFSGSMGI